MRKERHLERAKTAEGKEKGKVRIEKKGKGKIEKGKGEKRKG